MNTTIHLSGDEDLHIKTEWPDPQLVTIELRNPIAELTASPSGLPPAALLRRIDRPTARLIASALLAAASKR